MAFNCGLQPYKVIPSKVLLLVHVDKGTIAYKLYSSLVLMQWLTLCSVEKVILERIVAKDFYIRTPFNKPWAFATQLETATKAERRNNTEKKTC